MGKDEHSLLTDNRVRLILSDYWDSLARIKSCLYFFTINPNDSEQRMIFPKVLFGMKSLCHLLSRHSCNSWYFQIHTLRTFFFLPMFFGLDSDNSLDLLSKFAAKAAKQINRPGSALPFTQHLAENGSPQRFLDRSGHSLFHSSRDLFSVSEVLHKPCNTERMEGIQYRRESRMDPCNQRTCCHPHIRPCSRSDISHPVLVKTAS